jgi:hypothetical protein
VVGASRLSVAPAGRFLARNRRTRCRNSAISVTEGQARPPYGGHRHEHRTRHRGARRKDHRAGGQSSGQNGRPEILRLCLDQAHRPADLRRQGPRAFREFEKGNVHLGAIIKKDREAGFPEPQRIIVAQNLTENEAFEREMQEIAKHRRTKDGGTLTNMTDGGPGKAGDEAEIRRRLKALGKFRAMYVANSQRPTVFDYEECRQQCHINANSGRRVVLKRLFERPSTMQELCDHIRVMPPLGPCKGAQPATEASARRSGTSPPGRSA